MPQNPIKTKLAENYLQSIIPQDAGIEAHDAVKAALADPATQRAIDMAAGISGRVEFQGKNVTDAFLNFLKNAIPDYEKNPVSGKLEKILNLSQIHKNKENLFTQTSNLKQSYQQLIEKYMDALGLWQNSSSQIRNALEQSNRGNVQNIDLQSLANHFKDLVDTSNYKSPYPLFRGSSLNEIPNLKVGETFEHPFMSFSTNSKIASYFSDPNIISLPGGTKTLPIMGLSSLPFEFEHVVGGKFGIDDIVNLARRTIVKAHQIPE